MLKDRLASRKFLSLDGYKTYLGGLLMIAAVLLPAFGVPVDPLMLMQLGQGLSVIGVGHKLVKAQEGGR